MQIYPSELESTSMVTNIALTLWACLTILMYLEGAVALWLVATSAANLGKGKSLLLAIFWPIVALFVLSKTFTMLVGFIKAMRALSS